nr:uncharacterized protein LOC117994979 [Maniola hyperantus]
MSQKVCCVPGCSTVAGDGISLHRFPNPNQHIDLFQVWLKKIGGHVAELDKDYIYSNRRVCRRHFEDIYLYPTKLCSLAIPSLCLAENMAAAEAIIVSEPHTSSSFISNSNEMEMAPGLVATSSKAVPAVAIKLNSKDNLKAKKWVLTKQEKELCKEISNMRHQLKKCRIQKDYFKKKAAIKLKKTEAFELLVKNMSEETKTFFAMQVTQFGKKAKGRRFTIKEKILSLALYKRSPKAYRFLSSFSVLPKRKTLSTLLQKINLKPGKTVELFEELKKPVTKLNDNHKFCTIIFDEMAISPNLTYCRKNEIIGMVDDGEEKKKQICDHVLVFMVRGIIKKFKQPVYFTFCRGSTKADSLKAQIKTVIKEVEATGLKVVATVCDQGASNRAAINSLLNETRIEYLRDNKEWTGGFFELNKKKIFPLFDAPHLMKGIRNNLLNKNLMFTQDGKQKVAKWQHLEEMYHRQPGYKGVRLVPKLTAQHVVPKLIPKMKVKHCTQVFSRTVGVALGYMADCGQLPAENKDTADLLILMDELFDSVNGSYSKIRNGKIYRTAVTPKSPHHQLWRKSLPVLKSMVFVTKDGRKASVPSISSWIKTIEGFQLLINHLKSLNVTSLLLRHFNQDPLENFFGAIRAQGHSNNMPNAYGIQAAYKTLMIQTLTGGVITLAARM